MLFDRFESRLTIFESCLTILNPSFPFCAAELSARRTRPPALFFGQFAPFFRPFDLFVRPFEIRIARFRPFQTLFRPFSDPPRAAVGPIF